MFCPEVKCLSCNSAQRPIRGQTASVCREETQQLFNWCVFSVNTESECVNDSRRPFNEL